MNQSSTLRVRTVKSVTVKTPIFDLRVQIVSIAEKVEEFVSMLNSLPDKPAHTVYEFVEGRKYWRITMRDPRVQYSTSVYCFIDQDGNIYKAAGWRAPAKGIRSSLDKVLSGQCRVTWTSGWLYR